MTKDCKEKYKIMRRKEKKDREREWADRGETQMDERNVIDKVQ